MDHQMQSVLLWEAHETEETGNSKLTFENHSSSLHVSPPELPPDEYATFNKLS